MKIEFYKHNIDDTDKQELLRVLDSTVLTTGEITRNFEEKLEEYLGIRYVVGITSATNALELCLKYIGIRSGDEVITTPMSFIATANVIEYCGAKPVFVDVNPETGNINEEKILHAVSDKTKAIIPVHLYGQMCDMRTIKDIATKCNLKIIEDSAHCLEGERDGIKPGAEGDFSCYSFYATKSITSGEGGAIACNNQDAFEWFLKARLHGMSKGATDRYQKKYEHYDMEFLGYKCNMDNIQAALLLNQLDKVEELRSKREAIASIYDNIFSKNPAIRILMPLSNSRHCRHLYTILVDPTKRDRYMHDLYNAGIGVAVNYRAIHLMKYYREKYGYKEGAFPESEKIGDSTISLPLYPKLQEKEVDYVIKIVNGVVKN